MLTKSVNLNGGHRSQSCSSDVLKEETTPLPYGNFPVPFVRVSQTVKRFKPGTDAMVKRMSTAPSQTSSRFADTFTDLESRLGINANKSQVGEISETLQGSNLKIAGMDGLPHPNQISGKRKRQNIKRPCTTSANDINEHLSQLQRKHKLLAETKPVESVLITRDRRSNDSVLGPPNPSVVLETTKQCFLTFGADATLSWTSSRVSSLSSAGLAREGNALPSGAMPWEGLVANVQRQVVCAGGQQDGVVAVHTDQKRKLHSSALESPLDHFLSLYRNCLQQSSDDEDEENEFSAARFLGIRGSRPLAFSNDSGHVFASNAQPSILQSTGMFSGDDFPGQRSPFVSAGSSTMVIKDQILGLSERAADWNYESPYQTYETNVREE